MSSKVEVYYADEKTNFDINLIQKMRKVASKAGIDKVMKAGELVGIKMHLGEPGNLAYLRPPLAGELVKIVKEQEAKPFILECNTLYYGGRHNSVDHLNSARANGYVAATVDAPIIIGDGLRGTDQIILPVDGKHTQEARFASAVVETDAIIMLSHVKGHGMAGFGGAIKNLAMGGASRAGKQFLHADSVVEVDADKCIGCGRCVKVCPEDAIKLVDNKAIIDLEACQGCGECVPQCRYEAMQPHFGAGTQLIIQEKMAEYMLAIEQEKPGKLFYINAIFDVSPECDCWPHNKAPVAPNLGFVAGIDPVAVDQAALDLINESVDRKLFEEVHGFQIDRTLEYGEEIGLGSREYEMIKV